MKISFTLRFALVVAVTAVLHISVNAQAKLSAHTRTMLHELKLLQQKDEVSSAAWQRFSEEYGLVRRNGTLYTGVLALVDGDGTGRAALQEHGIHINTELAGMVTMQVPVGSINELAILPGVRYIETGSDLEPDLELARADTRADSVHAGLGGLPMGYTGEGVIVAVIDRGFDLAHPMFRDGPGQLRISRFWDQRRQEGPAPGGFDHGTEYVGMEQLLAAQTDTIGEGGSHGTHVAGIAGGSGAGTQYLGMAPESELVFISLATSSTALIDAFGYLVNYSQSVGKPFVVNMSFSNQTGPHDGSDLRSLAIEALAGPGRVFVASAGNNGNVDLHLHRDLAMDQDTLLTVVGFANTDENYGQAVSIWGSPGSSFSTAVRLVDNANNTIYESPFYYSQQELLVNDTIVLSGSDTLFLRLEGDAASILNGKPYMLWRIRKVHSGRLVLLVASDDAEIHLWNVRRTRTSISNQGVSLNANYPGATAGDNNYAVGEPVASGTGTITVAAHRAEEFTAQGNMLQGFLAGFSSRGPTVDGRVKPDISAPGQFVISSMSSFDTTFTSPAMMLEFEGSQYPLASLSGTSMSTPAVAGVVALMLQANPWLTGSEVKEILRQTARLDIRTGAIGPGGSTSWGWGKLNALAAILAAGIFVSVDELSMEPDDVILWPNPASDQVQIQGMMIERFRLFDQSGSTLMDMSGLKGSADAPVSFSIAGTPRGLYLLEIQGQGRVVYKKLVVQ